MSFITESQLAAYRTQTKTFSAESLENVFESSFDNKANTVSKITIPFGRVWE